MSLWTPRKLGEQAGLSDRHIRRLIMSGVIKAQKLGNTWAIDDDEAQRFIKERKADESDIQQKERDSV
ncbi:MAG: hypothetical protein JXA33_26270 [Anaerolineae bacterium]|nr:hypothetical protein [Anaerolineae bacterium]